MRCLVVTNEIQQCWLVGLDHHIRFGRIIQLAVVGLLLAHHFNWGLSHML